MALFQIFGWTTMTTGNWCRLGCQDWCNLPCRGYSPRQTWNLVGELVDAFFPVLGPPVLAVRFLVDALFTLTGVLGEESASSVALDQGPFIQRIPLLTIPSIGDMTWSFALNYQSNYAIDSIVGKGFNYPQNIYLEREGAAPAGSGPIDGDKVILNTPLNTKETFVFRQNPDRFVGFGTSSLLGRSGDGPTEEYTLSSRHGVVSKFFGFDRSMPTPGRVKSITDRYGNSQQYEWQLASEPGPCPLVQLAQVTDPYGRQIVYRYYDNDPNAGYRLQEIEDSLGRKLTFQYENGHLVAVMLPVLNQTVSGNEFPLGTAYVFQYEDDCDGGLLTKIWFPNQATPFIEEPSPGVRAVKLHGQGGIYDTATAVPRYTVSYNSLSQVSSVTIGDPNPAAGVGGTISYDYADLAQGAVLNVIDPLPDNPSEGFYRELKKRITVTDRNGNITESYLDTLGRTWKRVVKANRNKNSLQAAEYVTWFRYDPMSQLILVVFPEGNSVSYSYETGAIPGTIWTASEPYAKRVGLLIEQDRRPDNPNANLPRPRQIVANHNTPMNGLLSVLYFYEPLFNQLCATVEERGNPIDLMGNFFFPQNGGPVPSSGNRSRYASVISFDYQKNPAAFVATDAVLQAKLLLNSGQVVSLAKSSRAGKERGTGAGPGSGGSKYPCGGIGTSRRLQRPTST